MYMCKKKICTWCPWWFWWWWWCILLFPNFPHIIWYKPYWFTFHFSNKKMPISFLVSTSVFLYFLYCFIYIYIQDVFWFMMMSLSFLITFDFHVQKLWYEIFTSVGIWYNLLECLFWLCIFPWWEFDGLSFEQKIVWILFILLNEN